MVGTGTDVGKTHVSALLIRALRSLGHQVTAYKPFLTGSATKPPWPPTSDIGILQAACAVPIEPPFVALSTPVSLYRAAKIDNVAINIEAAATRAKSLASNDSICVIETAGGLFSPLTKQHNNADFAKLLSPCVVLLVAPDRLGVIHDVTATKLAAERVGVRLDLVVLSAPSIGDQSTGQNHTELKNLEIADEVVVIPRCEVDLPCEAANELARSVLSRLRLP